MKTGTTKKVVASGFKWGETRSPTRSIASVESVLVLKNSRLEQGGLIDRSKPLSFQFNGKRYTGFVGDTLGSALMANNVDVVSRSFKYHRPRGMQHYGSADVSSMVQIVGNQDRPNVLASSIALTSSMAARSVNCWPSVDFDAGAALGLLSPLLPAGFYYKTFMWPHWHRYEPYIRKLAGFGKAPAKPSSGKFYSKHCHCDVLVIGTGASGLTAARIAARSRARVMVVEQDFRAGGGLLHSSAKVDDMPAVQWAQSLLQELENSSNVTILRNSTAWGYLEGNMVCVVQRDVESGEQVVWNHKIWAKRVILASGAIERPICFVNNDLPGVMLTSAVSAMIRRFAVAPGKNAVVFVNNDQAYHSITHLKEADIQIHAIVDVREQVDPTLHDLAHACDTKIIQGSVVSKAWRRRSRISAVDVVERGESRVKNKIDCDLLVVSGGWNPAVHLFSQSRGLLRYHDQMACFVPDQPLQQSFVTGAAKGIFSFRDSINDAILIGVQATKAAGFLSEMMQVPEVSNDTEHYRIEPLWSVDDGNNPSKSFVDLAGDVTVFDLQLACREGFKHAEHLKRYTTTGMGLDQGKTANMNAIGYLSQVTDMHPSHVGTTTYRPPYTPVEFAAISGGCDGPELLPYRHTPMTKWHIENGAVMHEAGARWRRPAYYRLNGESMDQAIRRECASVRNEVGIYDGSPLGKFEITGRDRIRLLNLLFTGRYDNLNRQHGKYGIMLTDDGLIFDDGVVFRLDARRYLMTCSTGGALKVEQHVQKLIHVDQPDLNVYITPITSQWANATVCGPKAREMLESAQSNIDFSADSFRFMQMREGVMADMPVRIFRVSFTGELSFEINVPSRNGVALWEYLMELGEKYNICPVGSEANHVLRVEKGFLSLGHEVDGTVDVFDLGLNWIIDMEKSDFIGKRAVQIRRDANPNRQNLIGLIPVDTSQMIEEGAPLAKINKPGQSEGFVSACVWSDACKSTIALGLLENGSKRIGETVTAWVNSESIPATVTHPVFYDPKGQKLRM